MGILNATQTSQSSVAQTILFPQTMQMQREIFVPKGDYITPQDAEDFYEQAQRLPRLRINKCINKELVSDYERTRRITPIQHVELVTILGKRLARSS